MSEDKRAEAVDDLRSTSDAVLEEIDHLRRIEEERVTLPVQDERRLTLNREAKQSAQQLQVEARAESDLAEELSEDGGR